MLFSALSADVDWSLGATPHDTLPHRDGTARLYRFHRSGGRPADPGMPSPPLGPPPPSTVGTSSISKRGASVAGADGRGRARHTFCLDWGIPVAEDEGIATCRLGRHHPAAPPGGPGSEEGDWGQASGPARLLRRRHALRNLHTRAAPHRGLGALKVQPWPVPSTSCPGGLLAKLVDAGHFDADAVAGAGNVSPGQMQSGFLSLRPTARARQVGGLLRQASGPPDSAEGPRGPDRVVPGARASGRATTSPFPAAAYATYIKEMYQENQLFHDKHRVGGKPVHLSSIECPVLTVVASKDTIWSPRGSDGVERPLRLQGCPADHRSRWPCWRSRGKQGGDSSLPPTRHLAEEQAMQLKDLKIIVTGGAQGMGAFFAYAPCRGGRQGLRREM